MEVALEKELKRIAELLTDLSKYIKIKDEGGEFGINVIVESILRGFFDILFDCKLENMNILHKNYPAIDLGDRDQRIAIQVTASDQWDKIRDTLVGIKKHELYREYDAFYIFLYTAKEKPNLEQARIDSLTEGAFDFPKSNVLVIEDIYRILSLTKELPQIKKARKYLERHIPEHKKRSCVLTFLFALLGAGVLVVCLFFTSVFMASVNLKAGKVLDSHLLLELENANHQYDEGLENWRRLDYKRAYRDIYGARETVSEHVSQAEVEVARINNSLGCLCLDMGKYEEAYEYLNSARVTFKDVFGDGSIEARAVMFSIAQHDYYTGDYETALRMSQEIIDVSDPVDDRVIITTVSHFRAMVFDSLGDYDSALSVYEQVLALYEDIIEDGKMAEELSDYVHDPELDQNEKDNYTSALRYIILTYNNMGQVYLHLEEYDFAVEALQAGIDLSLNNIYIGQQNLTASKLYSNLAIVEAKRGETKAAIDHIDLAMRIQKKLFDYKDEYPGLVEVYDIYGTLLMEQEKREEAKEKFDHALELALEAFGENHPQTAEAYNALGTYWFDSGEYADAAAVFEKAVIIRKKIIGKEHPNTVKYYVNLAGAQIRLGEMENADMSLREAEEICDKFRVEGRILEQVEEYRREIIIYE